MNEETPKREFKGVWIPADIWLRQDLSWMEKCLLAEIDSLDDGSGCFASNEFLAKRFDSTPASIANILSRLRKLGLVKDRSFDGRKRFISATHSRHVQMKPALTQRLMHHQPTGEVSLNPSVNIDTSGEIRREKDEDKSSSERARRKEELQSLSLRIGAIMKRKPSTLWTPKEKKALSAIYPIPEDDIESIAKYYAFPESAFPKDKDNKAKDYRRHNLLTLLNNWPGEVDQANRFRPFVPPPRKNNICD